MLHFMIPVSSPHTTQWCKKRYFTFSALAILKPPHPKKPKAVYHSFMTPHSHIRKGMTK